jgi:lipoprotein-releasing system permease protein
VYLPLFIAKRLALPKQKTFSGFITRLCILATAISVAVMVISTSLFDGFEKAIHSKFYNCWGNIHVMNFDPTGTAFISSDTLLKDETLINNIKNVDGVTSIYPFQIKSGVFKSKTDVEGFLFKGVAKDYDWKRIKMNIVSGSEITYTDSGYSKEILLSSYMANRLQVNAGDSIISYFINQGLEAPKARKLIIKGIYSTGLYENDKLFAICDIRLIHRINNDTNYTIFGYEIMVKDFKKTTEISDNIYTKYLQPPVQSYTVQQRFAKVFNWLALVKDDLKIIYIIMIIVAIVNMITGILIFILERTRMVGILKSIGQKNTSIMQIFWWQCMITSAIGIALGVIIAVCLCLFHQAFPFIKLDPKVYYVSHLQIHLNLIKILIIALGTLGITALIMTIPTLLVKQIKPLKALRFD